MNTTIETILSHSSVRQYEDRAVSEEMLHNLIQCGQAASSSSFIQAACVIQVHDSAHRDAIADMAGGQPWVKNAPVFLVWCADMTRINYAVTRHNKGALEGQAEHFIAATVDVALMAQNTLLAAESEGLGGVFIGGIRNDPEGVVRCLQLPEHVYPVFGMCLGWTVNKPAKKPRMPVSAILHHDQFNGDAVAENVDHYDNIMREYYQTRTSNVKLSDWSEQTAKAVQDKKREHMLDFLNGRGFIRQ